jgi:apolipoprotein N-acyltransferase
MAEHGIESIPMLIRSLLDDTRELIREEVALARAEIRDDLASAQTVGIAFGAAAIAGLAGIMLLAVAIGGAIASAAGWPSWGGYGIVAILLFIAAAATAVYGRRQLARVRGLPKTTQTVKENLAWMQNKSDAK